MPNSRYQPVHTDGLYDSNYIAMGIPLGDVDEQNGSIEVFPGSHLAEMTLRAFYREFPARTGRRINTKSGDVILRHPNVWHRATPNRSGTPRFMLSFIFGREQVALHKEVNPLCDLTVDDEIEAASVVAALPAEAGKFFPNYFPRTPAGYLREVSCRYLPRLHNAVRLISAG
jgi:ectoine hydroxylase-related dioxygenase (phytanoyl-CoA dioxygenase family)